MKTINTDNAMPSKNCFGSFAKYDSTAFSRSVEKGLGRGGTVDAVVHQRCIQCAWTIDALCTLQLSFINHNCGSFLAVKDLIVFS